MAARAHFTRKGAVGGNSPQNTAFKLGFLFAYLEMLLIKL